MQQSLPCGMVWWIWSEGQNKLTLKGTVIQSEARIISFAESITETMLFKYTPLYPDYVRPSLPDMGRETSVILRLANQPLADFLAQYDKGDELRRCFLISLNDRIYTSLQVGREFHLRNHGMQYQWLHYTG